MNTLNCITPNVWKWGRTFQPTLNQTKSSPLKPLSRDLIQFGSATLLDARPIVTPVGIQAVDDFPKIRVDVIAQKIPEKLYQEIQEAKGFDAVVIIKKALSVALQDYIELANEGENFHLIMPSKFPNYPKALSQGLKTYKPSCKAISASYLYAALIAISLQNDNVFKVTDKGYVISKEDILATSSKYEGIYDNLKFEIINRKRGDNIPSIEEFLHANKLGISTSNKYKIGLMYQMLFDDGYIEPKDLTSWRYRKNIPPDEGFRWYTTPFKILRQKGLSLSQKAKSRERASVENTQALTVYKQAFGLTLQVAQYFQTLNKPDNPYIFPGWYLIRLLGIPEEMFREISKDPRLNINGEALFISKKGGPSKGTHVNPKFPELNGALMTELLGKDWECQTDTQAKMKIVKEEFPYDAIGKFKASKY